LSFATFRIGRAKDADVHIDHAEVSRRQIELTITGDGRYYLVDCAGACTTFVDAGGGWTRWTQGYVPAEARLRFGERRLRLRDLLAACPMSARPPDTAEPASVRPRRKVDTGEVELMPAPSGGGR